MTFETYKGIDRTTKQGTKPRVIFSESYNNLNRAKHTYSDETAKTKIVVGGAGDGADRIYVTVGGGTGFDLREEFLDAKDINKDDFSTNAEYLEALRIRGEQYKAENAVIENIEAEVEAEVNFYLWHGLRFRGHCDSRKGKMEQSIKFTHYGTLRGLRIRRNVRCSYFWGCPTHNHKLGQLGKERKSKWQ